MDMDMVCLCMSIRNNTKCQFILCDGIMLRLVYALECIIHATIQFLFLDTTDDIRPCIIYIWYCKSIGEHAKLDDYKLCMHEINLCDTFHDVVFETGRTFLPNRFSCALNRMMEQFICLPGGTRYVCIK